MARGHTKSRYGCRECKQRHIKCDESRPSCVNCRTIKRQCSFLSLQGITPKATLPHARLPSSTGTPLSDTPQRQEQLRMLNSDQAVRQQQAAPSRTSPALARSIGHDISTNTTSNTRNQSDTSSQSHAAPHASDTRSDNTTLPDDHFTITHLQLLHHYQTELSDMLLVQQPQAAPMLRYLVSQALTCPFLMDQVLSMAAAHKYTLSCPQLSSSSSSSFTSTREGEVDYFVEASTLQSRSMRKFHHAQLTTPEAASPITDPRSTGKRDPLAVLCFSMLVSHNALFFACAAATRLHCYHKNRAPPFESSSNGKGKGMTFGLVLDEFETCLMVHSGMAGVARDAIPLIDGDLRRELFGFGGKTILVDDNGGVGGGGGGDREETFEGGGMHRDATKMAGRPRYDNEGHLGTQDQRRHGSYPSPSSSSSLLSSSSLSPTTPTLIPTATSSLSIPPETESQNQDVLPPVELLEQLFSTISDTAHLEVYRTTLTVLLNAFREAASSSSPSPHDTRPRAASQCYLSATQHFLVRCHPRYGELLAQRRPEALVLFAYFAVLVHRAGGYWGVGPVAGRVLVKGIEDFLGGGGGFWGKLLAWPVSQVR